MRQKVYSIGIRQLVYRRSWIESESKTFHVLVVDLRHAEIKERYDRRFFKRNSNECPFLLPNGFYLTNIISTNRAPRHIENV